jgi:ABC-type Fe3+-hydroxamate transport system substrate-binding protein
VEAIPEVGGTKQVRMEAIHALAPDLIIAEKEEQTPEMVAQLAAHYPVYVTDVCDLPSAYRMLADLARLLNAQAAAAPILAAVQAGFAQLQSLPRATSPLPPKVLYLIWRKPWMGVGKGTYIDSILAACGWVNCLAQAGFARYPVLTPTVLRDLKPDFLLFSSEPYPFKTEHFSELLEHFPTATPLLVDGEAFSWYGSRMLTSLPYLLKIKDLRQVKNEMAETSE